MSDAEKKPVPDVKDPAHVERVLSDGEGLSKDHVDESRVDKEIAQYADGGMIEVDEATSKRLRRKIDRRVLVVMILTYFLQALDKGTMSFASIMGIREYAGLQDGNKVIHPSHLRPFNGCAKKSGSTRGSRRVSTSPSSSSSIPPTGSSSESLSPNTSEPISFSGALFWPCTLQQTTFLA